jgi:hypothetical protein
MRSPTPFHEGALPVPQARELDQICDQFEAAWQAVGQGGTAPRLEDYVARMPPTEQPALLRELVVLDLDYRRRVGQEPQATDYLQRFPALEPAWLEQELDGPRTKAERPAPPPHGTGPGGDGQRLRCPHCHQPIGLLDDQSDEVLCPACGGSFRVCEAPPTVSTGPGRTLGKFQLL